MAESTPEKVVIKSCALHKEVDGKNGKFKVFKVVLEDGRQGESFNVEYKAGDEAEITVEESQYGLKFKPVKKSFGGKTFTQPAWMKRAAALTAAIETAKISGKTMTSKEVLAVADLYVSWLG
jgi:hypothetical protein